MSMKYNIIRLFIVAVFAAFFVGCTVDETGIEGSFPYLELDSATKRLSKMASSDVVEVKTNRGVSVTFTPYDDWIKADVTGKTIHLSWQANELETERVVTMNISTDNSTVTKQLVLTQDASGEQTFDGNLILRSAAEIAENTYTKITGNLVIGNVTVPTKSVEESVQLDVDEIAYTFAQSTIKSEDFEPLLEQIHQIQGSTLVIANTDVTSIPSELIQATNVEKLYFDYNSLKSLSSSDISALNLIELSLRGNALTDIKPLANCSTIEYLNISKNNVYDLEPLKSMSALKKVVLNELPITSQQVEVLKEVLSAEVIADNLRTEESPLPIFGDIEIVKKTSTMLQIKVKVVNNAKNLSNYGFYIGNRRNLSEMSFHKAVHNNGVLTLNYNPPTMDGVIYYVRGYAENASGGNYSKTGYFGNVTSEDDLYFSSDQDFIDFENNPYSHVNGSVIIGKTSSNGNGILLNDGNYYLYFSPTTFTDMSPIHQLVYIRDGLYAGNIGLTNLDDLYHIQGLKTLWVKGNNISYIPELASDSTLKYLDVSQNNLTDFNFLERMPALEVLYLGTSGFSSSETNDIGVVKDLANYQNLKFIDLGGLPIHEWQVEELRAQMPNTDIFFMASGRSPHLPTLKVGRLTRKESTVTLSASLVAKGKSDIQEYGFYYGKDLSNLEQVVVGSSLGEGESFTYDVTLPDMDMYYFYPYATNSQGEGRCAHEEFSLSYMNLSLGETANCYHIPTPGKYKFDARVRGNSIESVGEVYSAGLMWEFTEPGYDTYLIKSVEVEDGFVKFETYDDVTYGNALIYAKDAAGTILWSWHIWLCDFDPDESAQRYKSGNVLMDRNLGATLSYFTNDTEKKRAYGTHYQWGRKDPMTYGTVQETVWAFTSVEDTYSRPASFVTSWTWLDNGLGSYDLWSADRKTMHDPCPPGWKVADSNSWNDISIREANEYGVTFDYDGTNPAYYPYGPRIDENFIYHESTWEGKMWTSDTFDYWYPTCLNYYNYNTYSIETFTNSNAMSVRCMKDYGIRVSTISAQPKADSVILKGEVQADAAVSVTDRGFVWYAPTSSDYRPSLNDGVSSYEYVGGSTGNFDTIINGLMSETTYNVRAFALVDGVTRYGEVLTFKTGRVGDGESFTEDDYEW